MILVLEIKGAVAAAELWLWLKERDSDAELGLGYVYNFYRNTSIEYIYTPASMFASLTL